MEFLFTLLAGIAFPALPTLAGWTIWLTLLGLLVIALFRWRPHQPEWKGREWGFFAALLIFTALTSLFIGIRLSSDSTRPLPGVPADAPGSALMIFSAIPWLLGGGLLGPWGGALLGAVAGLLRGALDTYSLFSVLELALLGAWFALHVRQRFRTPAYALLRQPLIAALLLIPFHLLFYTISALFTQWSADVFVPATARLDFALSNSLPATLAFGGEMLVGGLVAQIFALTFPGLWGSTAALQPSPAERSMESRFLFSAGTFIVLLLITLLAGDWIVAGRAARGMLQDRLASAAEATAQGVPFFLETGQNLAAQVASDPRILSASGIELDSALASGVRTTPYFDQLFVMDATTHDLLGAYPDAADIRLFPAEDSALLLASSGVLNQFYSMPAASPHDPVYVSFVLGVMDSSEQVQRVLICRTSLQTNPLFIPLIDAMNGTRDFGGSGFLLNENGEVLYHSNGEPLAAAHSGEGQPVFYDNTAADGTRQFEYYQPVNGYPWAVVLTVPAREAQQLALDIALPLSVMIILLALVAMASLRLGLRVVTGSLKTLAVEADRMARGNLDHSLHTEGVDEVGQLRRAFEHMRVSLQARLEEGDQLLRVSQGVASSLEMQDSVQPVLEAIQSIGANSVRVVLSPSVLPETFFELPSRFSAGPTGEQYAHLDDQVLALAHAQERIVIPNLSRSRELDLDPSKPQPLALLAVALRRENRYYGVVWAGFEQPRMLTDSNVRFVTTLAGQAALAVANAHLYLNVEASRRQMEAILNSTADPVLVTDQRNRLVLANRSAIEALGIEKPGNSIVQTEKVVKLRALLDLLQDTSTRDRSAEVVLADGRTYLATASSVMVDGRQIARVCIMRDVTHFKELDSLKSEFVATVSHDLRSPLTLMRGYATMLEMVGQLNEQQQGYVQKMIAGVDSMARLVNNLLDLGRIEIGVGLEVESVGVADIMQRVTNTLQAFSADKQIALNVEIPRDLPQVVEADGSLLYQAVYNLVENAVKYTPAHGQVTLRAALKPGYLVFEVTDSGIGIPPDDQPRLFEKFYRARQREAREQPGSGLGLAIVRSIAERHGGRVWVQSELGRGSTFHLQIPLVQSRETEPA